MTTIARGCERYFSEISQALFFWNPWVGAALLLLILYFDPGLFVFGALASLIGFFCSERYSTPKILRDSGLITINGLFFGIAMASLFEPSPAMCVCTLLGALIMPRLTKASHEVLQHWKLSPFIFPYILAIWSICLAAHGSALKFAIAALPSLHPEWPFAFRILESSFRGIGRLLFLPDPLFGIGVLLLTTLFSPRRGLYFFLGTLVATLIAVVLAGNSAAWEYGYANYCAGLVGLGLASFQENFGARTILLFCGISAVLSLAVSEALATVMLPPLSLPYVLTLWFALLSRVPRLNLSWRIAPGPRSSPRTQETSPQTEQEPEPEEATRIPA